MTDGSAPRPRPQYGEYATPEQQQEIIRQSGGVPPAPPQWAAPETITVGDAAPPTPADVAAPDAPRRRRGDRFLTIALLAYGLFTVITTAPQLLDYATFAEMGLEMAGIDADFTAFDAGRLWGGVSAALFALGWLLTAFLSWRAIVRGRLSWWIALVGAVVTFVIVSVCLSVPLMSDPAIIDQVVRAG